MKPPTRRRADDVSGSAVIGSALKKKFVQVRLVSVHVKARHVHCVRLMDPVAFSPYPTNVENMVSS